MKEHVLYTLRSLLFKVTILLIGGIAHFACIFALTPHAQVAQH